MKRIILILFLSVAFQLNAVGQAQDIFPEYFPIKNAEKYYEVITIDLLRDSSEIRKSKLDKKGRIVWESFNNYIPTIGRYPLTAIFHYHYTNWDLPTIRLHAKPNEDTLRVYYSYSKDQKLAKRVDWEYEKKTKLRKGAPEYGDGKPGGCIPAEEDLIRFREWTRRATHYYKYNKGHLAEIESGTSSVEYFYGKNGRLLRRRGFGNKKDQIHWEENFSYYENSIVSNKTYFVTYFGKLPPSETLITKLNREGQEVELAKDYGLEKPEEKLIKSYNDSGNLVRLTKYIGSEKKTDYLIKYKNNGA